VTLVPLSPPELRDFMERQIAEYAEEEVRAGHWSREEAMELSRGVTSKFFTEDSAAQGHRFFKGVDEAGREVGWIWVGPPPTELGLERARWLYQITVAESSRGRGYGRGMLQAMEDLLAGEGVRELYLNVFRWNRVARSLYDSAGYEVVQDWQTETRMRKRLDARGT
jgi:GNAT superfamily N-acetyltransferase